MQSHWNRILRKKKKKQNAFEQIQTDNEKSDLGDYSNSAMQNNFVEAEDDDHIKITVEASEDIFSDEQTELSDSEAHPVVVEQVVEAVEPEKEPVARISGEAATATNPAQQLFLQSPELQRMMMNMVEEGMKSALKQAYPAGPGTPGNSGAVEGKGVSRNNCVKSPSDTTIYAPALKLVPPNNLAVIKTGGSFGNNQATTREMENNISEFVENICIQVENDDFNEQPLVIGANQGSMRLVEQQRQQPDNQVQTEDTLMRQAREEAKNMVVRSQQQKAIVDPAQGMDLIGTEHGMGMLSQDRYSDVVDDKFFHITCHVEPGLRAKIESGQFVELEKLLIKDRPSSFAISDNRMGLYQRDGQTYFAHRFH